LTSKTLLRMYFHRSSSPAALNWSSACSRRTTSARSGSVRNLAVSGKSWMMKNESAPAMTVIRPSRMKIHALETERRGGQTAVPDAERLDAPAGFAADAVHVGDRGL
jgi:hypothetical protein